MAAQPLLSDSNPATSRTLAAPQTPTARKGALARGLGLALAPMLLFLSIPVGLGGGFIVAWTLLGASLVLIMLDVALFGGGDRR